MLNKLILMGRLCETPELKTTQNGVQVTSFSLAVDRNYSTQGREKKTDFVKCVAWRNTAEFITRYFSKGKLVVVEAELQSRSYDNKNGDKVTVWEAIVGNAYFAGDKKTDESQPQQSFESTEIAGEDDLPF